MYQGNRKLLALSFFIFPCLNHADDKPVLPMFLVTPVVKAPAIIYSGQVVSATYRITNNSPNNLNNTDLVNPPFGLTQITGLGLCTKPFNLAPGASCLLKLQIVADNLQSDLIGGPLICSTPKNPIYCAGPTLGNELNSTKENTPPPAKVLLIVYGDKKETFWPNTVQSVAYGATQSFRVIANTGYTLNPQVGGNCVAGYWSNNDYTTGALTYPCTLNFTATANSYAISTLGENLTAIPATAMANYNSTSSFTLIPDPKYKLSQEVGGDCPQGSWKDDTYTTGSIITQCTIIFNALKKTVPNPPTRLTAQAADGSVTLNWMRPDNDGGSAITSYQAISMPDKATCSTRGATHCTINKLNNGQSYIFTVTATNSIGTGPQSLASAPITPATIPSAPQNLSAAATNSAALLNWTEPENSGGAKITGYIITPYMEDQAQASIVINTNRTTAIVKGLKNGSVYNFTVAAVNAMGTSAPSPHSNSVTPDEKSA